MLNKKLLLAPLASITHRAFREIVSSFGGCDEYITEMISASALINGSHYERFYVDSGPEPHKLTFQLVGHKKEHILSAVDVLQSYESKGIDLNMGCSAPFLRKKGAGSAWMEKPSEAYTLVEEIKTKYPKLFLSIKIRLGEVEDLESLVEFSKEMVNSGIDRITLHPRTTKQKFTRISQWKYVEALAQSLSIPVIGSGDVKSQVNIKQKNHGAWDGIMIGRAAVENPWIFAHAKHIALKSTKQFCSQGIDLESIGQIFFENVLVYQPEDFWKSRLLAFYSYFLKNLIWHHDLFTEMKNQSTPQQIQNLFSQYFIRHPQEKIKSID